MESLLGVNKHQISSTCTCTWETGMCINRYITINPFSNNWNYQPIENSQLPQKAKGIKLNKTRRDKK